MTIMSDPIAENLSQNEIILYKKIKQETDATLSHKISGFAQNSYPSATDRAEIAQLNFLIRLCLQTYTDLNDKLQNLSILTETQNTYIRKLISDVDKNNLDTAKNMQRIELELGTIRSQTTQIGQIVDTLRQQHPVSDMTSIDSQMKSIKKDMNKALEKELVEVIDIDQDLENFKQKSLKKFNPQVLYKNSGWTQNSMLIQKISERSIQCGDKDHVILDLMNKDSINQIRKKNYDYTHLGLIIIGIKGMTRSDLGTHVLITPFDSRLTDQKKSILALMDADMNKNVGLFYFAPNFFMPTKDLDKIKIGILTKGFGNISTDNLNITIGLLGKSSQNSNMQYKYNIEDVITAIRSKGVRFIEPPKYQPTEYAGVDWDLDKILSKSDKMFIPERGQIFENHLRQTSVRFSQYNNIPIADTESEFSQDNESEDVNV
ncbi:hypothetical protein RJ639_011218 [Escallonia herrerae]|uniref:Uncharacterized protein n=1 Tax=Escallonia herrerae TaxID=1293975 RepID=A0AA88VM29_9ASTE|nr:hypothetical protein RJ639_011218 [Escallonia herrerae]